MGNFTIKNDSNQSIFAVIDGGASPDSITTGALFTNYGGQATVGQGIAPILAAVATASAVSLQTTSTAILSLASGLATGIYRVTVGVTAIAAAQTTTFTITYTDATTSAGATITISSGILGNGGAFGDSVLINALTGTAIAVTGTVTTNNDGKAIAAIEQIA